MARAGDRSRMKRRTTRVIGVLLLVTVGLLAVGVGAAAVGAQAGHEIGPHVHHQRRRVVARPLGLVDEEA